MTKGRWFNVYLFFLFGFAAMAGTFIAISFHRSSWSWFSSIVSGVLFAIPFLLAGHMLALGLFKYILLVRHLVHSRQTRRNPIEIFFVSFFLIFLVLTLGGIALTVGAVIARNKNLFAVGFLTTITAFTSIILVLLFLVILGLLKRRQRHSPPG